MSIEIPLDDLAEAVAARGDLAYLVTIGATGPRVVSVSAQVETDGTVRVGAGRHSAANVADRRAVTIFWPIDADHPKHTLLVDGTASVDGEEITVRPTGAMLHRVRVGRGSAGLDDAASS